MNNPVPTYATGSIHQSDPGVIDSPIAGDSKTNTRPVAASANPAIFSNLRA
jgi:hypothetical protein